MILLIERLRRLLSLWGSRFQAARLVALLVALYAGALLVFRWGGEEALSQPLTALWWFFVTITTVGYGDFAPQTWMGRGAGLLVMLVGVGIMALLLTKIATYLYEERLKKMKGLATYDFKDHLVILGYESPFTDDLLGEVLSDTAWSSIPVVVCDDALEENPCPVSCHFVRGVITSDDVATRSALSSARHIIVHGKTDEETRAAAILASLHHAPEARVLAYVRSQESVRFLARVAPRVTAVSPIEAPILAQELQDRGVFVVMDELLRNGGETIYACPLPPESLSFNTWKDLLQEEGALLLGYGEDSVQINPPGDVHPEGQLFVIAKSRPHLGDILKRVRAQGDYFYRPAWAE